jgi:hypothetical protein
MALPPLLPRVTDPEASSCPPCACGGVPRCLCTCQFPREPLFILCENCFPTHLQTLANHNYLEVAAYGFVRGIEDLTELRKRNAYRSEMKESLRKIETCRKELETSIDQLMLFLHDYKGKICEKLDECVAKVNDGLVLIDKMQYTPAQTFHFPYRNVSFTYSISTSSVTQEIENICRFDIGNSCEVRELPGEEEEDIVRIGPSIVKTEETAELYPQKRKGGAVQAPKKKKTAEETMEENGEENVEDKTGEMDVLVVNFTP